MFSVFIASSSEGLKFAKVVARELKKYTFLDVRPWWEKENWRLNTQNIESLTSVFKECDYAFFIVTPDEAANSRNKSVSIPRDNVILEYGLFIGLNGRDSAVYFQVGEPKKASDLDGLVSAKITATKEDLDLKTRTMKASTRTAIVEATRNALRQIMLARDDEASAISQLHGTSDRVNQYDVLNVLKREKQKILGEKKLFLNAADELQEVFDAHFHARTQVVGLGGEETEVHGFIDLDKLADDEINTWSGAYARVVAEKMFVECETQIDRTPTRALLMQNDNCCVVGRVCEILGLKPILVDTDDNSKENMFGPFFKGESCILLYNIATSGRYINIMVSNAKALGVEVTHVFSLARRMEKEEKLRQVEEGLDLPHTYLFREKEPNRFEVSA